MSTTPEDSGRRLASQGDKELTPQETQVELVNIVGRRLEGCLDPVRLRLGKAVTLEALLLERDYPKDGVFRDYYNEEISGKFGQEYVYPVVLIAGEEGWFVLGGINFSEPKKVQVPDYNGYPDFEVDWGGERTASFYYDRDKWSSSWWSDGQRVFMRDEDSDVLSPGIKRLALGASTVERLLATIELSGLFEKGEFAAAFLAALDRAALTPPSRSDARRRKN